MAWGKRLAWGGLIASIICLGYAGVEVYSSRATIDGLVRLESEDGAKAAYDRARIISEKSPLWGRRRAAEQYIEWVRDGWMDGKRGKEICAITQ